MKRKLCIITLISSSIVFLTSFSAMSVEPVQDTALKAEAVSIVKKFAKTLKSRLKKAIQSGGLGHAMFNL